MKSGYDPAQVMGLMVQSVSVHFSPGQESPPRRVMRIEEPFCDDVIRTLSKVDGPALPGTEKGFQEFRGVWGTAHLIRAGVRRGSAGVPIKRPADTCDWPATSSSACSSVRQLVCAPRMRTSHSQPSRRSTSGKSCAKSRCIGQASCAASRSAPCQLRSSSVSSA